MGKANSEYISPSGEKKIFPNRIFVYLEDIAAGGDDGFVLIAEAEVEDLPRDWGEPVAIYALVELGQLKASFTPAPLAP